MTLSQGNLLKYWWDLKENKWWQFLTLARIIRTLKPPKRFGWGICYGTLRGFCARRLITWKPLPESFWFPSWYKTKDQRELLFSPIPQTFAKQGSECFTKCGAVQGLKGPIFSVWILVQSSTHRQAACQMPAKHCQPYALLAHKYTNIAVG